MDIVDGQVHANVLGAERTLAIMDALGIQSILIDEYLASTPDGAHLPDHKVPSGVSRPIAPNAEAAALCYPERFSYLMRINPFDPALEAWLETIAASPNLRALRTGAAEVPSPEGTAFEDGGLDRVFAAIARLGLPVFVTCPSRVSHLAAYVRKFPDVQFIIDHCGADSGPPGKRSMENALRMAAYPNVALKWTHAPLFFSVEPYPFRDLEPTFKQAIDAFGPERVLWASDYTVVRKRENWGESLFGIRNSPSLSERDKEWVLGRTIRRLLDWPAPIVINRPGALHPRREP